MTDIVDSFAIESVGMQIDINSALRQALIDYCRKTIREAADTADAPDTKTIIKAAQTIDGLLDDNGDLKHHPYLLAGIMHLCGFEVTSAELTSDWGPNSARNAGFIDALDIEGMRININGALRDSLIDYCNDEIRAALQDGDLAVHMEEMSRTIQGLKDGDINRHPRHVFAGLMSIAGFRLVSVDWASDWSPRTEAMTLPYESPIS